ncbi:hypothetical protein KR009_009354 [Drosophila setifemur]|nr:hypothetical protein KR009_009354 [Drosophila setifemur]
MWFLRRQTRRFRSAWQRILPRRIRRWKNHSQLVLWCLSGTIFLNILYGLYLGRFSFRRKKFVRSNLVTAYCVIVATIFGIFYTWHIYTEVSTGQISRRHTIGIYGYMNVCVALINYVTQWKKTSRIVAFQNSVPLFKVLNSLDISMMLVWHAFMYGVLKIIACPLLESVALLLYQRRSNPEMKWTSLSTVRMMLPLIVSNQINNCYYGGLIIADLVLASINNQLTGIVKEVNMLQSPDQMDLHKPYYRMRRFCELADTLDKLAKKYSFCTRSAKYYLRFTDESMVLSMLMNLIGLTMGLFNQYMTIADHYINEEPFDLFLTIVQLFFLAVPFLELVFLARISNQMLLDTRKTGDLLQLMNLQHADIRFKQVVNAFWLQATTINFKLMPMGLLELNTSLVNMVFSSVFGFLLILIQSDLTLRFSLK